MSRARPSTALRQICPPFVVSPGRTWRSRYAQPGRDITLQKRATRLLTVLILSSVLLSWSCASSPRIAHSQNSEAVVLDVDPLAHIHTSCMLVLRGQIRGVDAAGDPVSIQAAEILFEDHIVKRKPWPKAVSEWMQEGAGILVPTGVEVDDEGRFDSQVSVRYASYKSTTTYSPSAIIFRSSGCEQVRFAVSEIAIKLGCGEPVGAPSSASLSVELACE